MNGIRKGLSNKIHDYLFSKIHGGRLIYNTCWEDPRIDRKLLQIDSNSSIIMITSAGCNALDYLLDKPVSIHAIDMNFRQNALLELKKLFIQHTDYPTFFSMFGNGACDEYKTHYNSVRSYLTEDARAFWDKKITYFRSDSRRKSFYFHSASGDFAWFFTRFLFRMRRGIKDDIMALIESNSLEEQQEIYERIEPRLWNRITRRIVSHPLFLSLIGVPRPQVRLIEQEYEGGFNAYVREKLKTVLTELPVSENYFWRVYLTGSYTHECCPNYLKEENFSTFRETIHRIQTHTCTITDFLKGNPGSYSHYILLDHQDWLAQHAPEALKEEWEVILENSTPGTRILMRSAGITLDFLPDNLKRSLTFFTDKTRELHQQDRVGTYGSLHFSEVVSPNNV